MKERLIAYAKQYNDPQYFESDPIIFPKHFYNLYKEQKASIQDIEIAGVIATHLAWGRRNMIVRDCNRAFDEMKWKPFEYVRNGEYKCNDCSLHRTVKWSEFAQICANLRELYCGENALYSIESLSADQIRTLIYSQKSNPKAANKKIHLFRRWMVRNDGIVDLGIWHNTSPRELIIPLDVHVHRVAKLMGITQRNSMDLSTAQEITDYFKEVFPDDPCKGDFALFGYGVSGDFEKWLC